MKILKKLLMICLLIFASVCVFTDFSADKKTAYAKTTETFNFSNAIQINSNSELGSKNVIKQNNNKYTIISNYAVSFALNIFEHKFDLSHQNTDLTNFHVSIKEIELTFDDIDPSIGSFQDTFNGETTEYFFRITNNMINIYTSKTLEDRYSKFKDINTETITTFGIAFDGTNLFAVSNITYNFNQLEEELYLKLDSTFYIFKLIKPLVNFYKETETIVQFEFVNKDTTTNHTTNWLPSERSYNELTIKFFRNYSESNPLFFNINLNGFTYFYKIFTKDNLLYLHYIDENEETSKQLIEKTYAIFNGNLDEGHTFNVSFTETGRYEVEFYDFTYNTSLSSEENLKNKANYYKTSFYIYNKNIAPHENIYIVSQAYENNQPVEYIVSNNDSQTAATINNDVRATIKNLQSLSEEDFVKISIDVEKYTFEGTAIPEITTYDSQNTKLRDCYDKKTDFFIDLTVDARYNIKIYYEDREYPILTTTYHIVKLPKMKYQVDGFEPFTQTEYYTKTEIDYKIPLRSQLQLQFSYNNFNNLPITEDKNNCLFDKLYINEFSVFYGIPVISIQRYTRMVSNGSDSTAATTLDIEIKAVGATTVTVLINGTKTVYNFKDKSTKKLSFEEFGLYTIHVQDEMGTTSSATFNYQKTLNTSSILLIVFASILVLGVVIFIVMSRSKLSTR